MTHKADSAKLPLWRLIAALVVLAAMAGVLLALVPVYFEDYRLGQYVKSVARGSGAAAASDDMVRADVVRRARQLDLPVTTGDVKVSHPGGKLKVEVACKVQMDFPLYQVDLHFHPSATAQ